MKAIDIISIIAKNTTIPSNPDIRKPSITPDKPRQTNIMHKSNP